MIRGVGYAKIACEHCGNEFVEYELRKHRYNCDKHPTMTERKGKASR